MIEFNRRFDPKAMKLLIFDLDGTLIDSRLDLVNSVNAMLRHFQCRQLPGDVIASYVGDGAPMLVRRALGDLKEEAVLSDALDYFVADYRIHRLDHTNVYQGILEMLAAAQSPPAGPQRQLSILSNKPVSASRAIVEALGMVQFFVSVYGGDSFATRKPDPLGAKKIMEETHTEPEHTLVVGDSSNDVLTGRNAGTWTCGVTYGFAPHGLCAARPDVVVDTPDELKSLLDGAV